MPRCSDDNDVLPAWSITVLRQYLIDAYPPDQQRAIREDVEARLAGLHPQSALRRLAGPVYGVHAGVAARRLLGDKPMLTNKQRRVLVLLRQDERLSLEELAELLGVVRSTTYAHVRGLEAGGYITRRRGQARSIRLTERGRQEKT